METEFIDKILAKHPKVPASIIQVMLDVQNELYYLPKDILHYISKELDVPISRTYNLATFYKAFSLKPKGKHPISVCTGTACHVQGAGKIMEQFERELGIKEGETTPDNKFSLESVRCLGCCGLAPVIVIDENFHGKLAPVDAVKALEIYK